MSHLRHEIHHTDSSEAITYRRRRRVVGEPACAAHNNDIRGEQQPGAYVRAGAVRRPSIQGDQETKGKARQRDKNRYRRNKIRQTENTTALLRRPNKGSTGRGKRSKSLKISISCIFFLCSSSHTECPLGQDWVKVPAKIIEYIPILLRHTKVHFKLESFCSATGTGCTHSQH